MVGDDGRLGTRRRNRGAVADPGNSQKSIGHKSRLYWKWIIRRCSTSWDGTESSSPVVAGAGGREDRTVGGASPGHILARCQVSRARGANNYAAHACVMKITKLLNC
jgi:hypothetical protein